MKTIRTRTGQPSASVRRRLGGLVGTLTDSQQAYSKLFTAHFLQNLLTRIHRNFITKAKGQPDELGYQWEPLADSTIRAKQRSQSPNKRFDENVMPQATREEWQRLYTNFRRQLGGQGAENKARALAWQTLSSSGKTQVPIGIASGELISALRPGRIVGNTYRPPRNQIIEQTANSTSITLDVEHAKHFHRKRRIYPTLKQMRPWVRDAADAALTEVTKQIAEDLK